MRGLCVTVSVFRKLRALCYQLATSSAAVPSNARVIQDFFLCFDAFDKKALRDQLQSKVSAVLTALRIGADGRYEFRSIIDGSYVTTEEGQVVHSASFEAGSVGVYSAANPGGL